MQTYDAIVLAGGTGRRLGGIDKAALDVGAGPLLDGALAAVTRAGRIVVVGPARALPAGVIQVSEDPPGGGPVAAVAAGLTRVEASVVVVLACDMPFVSAAVVDLLARAAGGSLEADTLGPVDRLARQAGDQPDPDARPGDLQTRSERDQPDPDASNPADLQTRSAGDQPDPDPARPGGPQTRHAGDQPDPDLARPGDRPKGEAEPDAVMLVDANGRRQFLAAAYRTAPLREALSALETTDGAAMRQVVRRLAVAELTADPEVTLDCDTWADVQHSRDLLEGR